MHLSRVLLSVRYFSLWVKKTNKIIEVVIMIIMMIMIMIIIIIIIIITTTTTTTTTTTITTTKTRQRNNLNTGREHLLHEPSFLFAVLLF